MYTKGFFSWRWVQYYFHLDGNVLFWYEKRENVGGKPSGIFKLKNASVQVVLRNREFEGCEFELINSKKPSGNFFWLRLTFYLFFFQMFSFCVCNSKGTVLTGSRRSNWPLGELQSKQVSTCEGIVVEYERIEICLFC